MTKETRMLESRAGESAFAVFDSSFGISSFLRHSAFGLRHYDPGKPPALPEDPRSSTVPGVVRYAGSEFLWLPLTLTLSRWEREQQPDPSRTIKGVRFFAARRTFLPLRAGEGRGEGRAQPCESPRSGL